MARRKNRHVGSSVEDFLAEEGILESSTLKAVKAVIAWQIAEEMKRQNIKLVLVEPYFDLKTPNSIGQQTGAQVVVMLPSVGGVSQVTDYFKLFDHDVALLVDAIKKSGGA